KIKKILIPIDFSAASHQAIKFALPLLNQFGAEVHLVHVTAPDVPLAGLAAMPIVLSKTASARLVGMHLSRVAKKYAPGLESITIHTLRGTAFEEICRLARKIDIDLIVISTRGPSRWRHLTVGSTAERVVRYSPCPVLVVRPPQPSDSRSGNGHASHV